MIIGIERSDGGVSIMHAGELDDEAVVIEIKRWEVAQIECGRDWTALSWHRIEELPPRENRNAYAITSDGKLVQGTTE